MRFGAKKIVFTNGCFDVLHPGHLHLLESCKAFGEVLVLGLNSDDSVRRLKGATRPIHNQENRIFQLSSLLVVDAVVVFEEDTPLELIKLIKPDVLVKGGDYSVETIVGAKEVMAAGGQVEVIPLLEGHSSTGIIEGS